MSAQFVAVFINLDTDHAKRASMQAQLEKSGAPWLRQEAVRGRAIPDVLRDNFDLATPGACELLEGEIGCFASHLLVATRVAANEFRRPALVLEDDTSLPPDIVPLLDAAIAALPAGWDIVRLSDLMKRVAVSLAPLPGGRRLVRYSKIPNGAGAYLLSVSGAKKFARMRARTLAFDQELVHAWNLDLDTYGVWPQPIASAQFPSSIDAMQRGRLKRVKKWGPGRAEFALGPRRLAFNIGKLGFATWARCALVNARNHVARRIVKGAKRIEVVE